MRNGNRKCFVLGITTFIISASCLGQGIYAGINGGYGFPSGRMILPSDQKTTYSGSSSSTLYTSNKYSLGKGIDFGAYGGYMFNKHWGAELEIGYLIGGTSTSTNEDDSPTIPSTTTETRKGNILRFTPALRYQIGENKLKTYITAGIIIGMASGTDEIKDISGPNTGDNIWTYSGGPTIGFHGAIGLMYFLSNKLGISAELTGNYQNWSPDKEVLTTSTLNGVDNLSKMPLSQKETDYQASYTKDPFNPTPATSPSISDRIYLPFSSLGLNIGVHIFFGGK